MQQVVLRRTLDVVVEVVFLKRSLRQHLPAFYVDPRVVERLRRLPPAGMQEVGLDLPQPRADLVDRQAASSPGHPGPLLDGRNQRLVPPPHVDEALDVLHEVLLDVGHVHRDDIDCQVLQDLSSIGSPLVLTSVSVVGSGAHKAQGGAVAQFEEFGTTVRVL